MEQITVAMMKYCLTVLMLFSVPALALDVRALKDKPAAVVEELPASAPSVPKQPEKKSLVEHLQQTSQTPHIPSGPPTSLPPSGNLPPLPPSMTAPKGKWSELPPLPDGTQLSVPSARTPSSRASSGAGKAARPAKTNTSAVPVNTKEKFAQCVSEVQQQSQGKPTKLLRNDNQVYSVVLVENGQRKIITCYANKDKTIE